MTDYLDLPAELPVPEDDGAARHLPGARMPGVTLTATSGEQVALDSLGAGRTVVYVYPRSGVPGVALPAGWDEIPGARGCTPESCGFRDHYAELLSAGAVAVFGMSTQDTDYQRELADRINLPFPLLSDAALEAGTALRLPSFDVDGVTLYKRLTMIVDDGVVEHVFYPVFPPDAHAEEVLAWLRSS